MKPTLLSWVLIFPTAAVQLADGIPTASLLKRSGRAHHAVHDVRRRQRSEPPEALLRLADHEAQPPPQPPQEKEYSIIDPRGRRGKLFVLTILALIFIAIVVSVTYARQNHFHSQGERRIRRKNKGLPQDTYGFGVASLIRDLQMVYSGQGSLPLRSSRVAASAALLALNIFIQVAIIVQVQKFVTRSWVHGIREDYDRYELHMYGTQPGRTTTTVDGGHRGVPGNFQPEMFDSLPPGLKGRVCNIPFSEPTFFLTVLFIWTLTCIGELRQCIALFEGLILRTPIIKSMSNALKFVDEDGNETSQSPNLDVEESGAFRKRHRSVVLTHHNPHLAVEEDIWEEKHMEVNKVIDGLTASVKTALLLLIIIPRFVISVVLLWLGCRFLAATNDFGDLLLNSVALEFVILFKDLIYTSVVPERNKREVESIHIHPSRRIEAGSYWSFLGSFAWAIIAFIWIIYYMYWLQAVLPDYRWDVRTVCSKYIETRYAV